MAKRKKGVAPIAADDYFTDAFKVEDKTAVGAPEGWPAARPLTVDRLTWNFTAGDGDRKDLKEWLDVFFDPCARKTLKKNERAGRVLCEVIGERFGHPVKTLWTFLEFARKGRHPSLAWQVACWNEMLHRLGYEVPAGERRDPGLGEGDDPADVPGARRPVRTPGPPGAARGVRVREP